MSLKYLRQGRSLLSHFFSYIAEVSIKLIADARGIANYASINIQLIG